MIILIYFLFNFSLQMIMVHLVNHATDLRIDPFLASTLLSVIGITSILGRLIMGTASDRIGGVNALTICCVIVVVSLVWLIFAK
jgi:MFS family permease